ncbi:MAG TPA: HEAT repeat domain-containing protein [Terriglobia bacterium]
MNRLIYDRQRRLAQRIRRQLNETHELVSRLATHEEILPVLQRLPRKTIEAIAVESRTLPWQARIFAMYVVQHWGAGGLVRAASRPLLGGKWLRIEALRILALAEHPASEQLLEKAVFANDDDLVGAAVSLLGHRNDLRSARLLVTALRLGSYSRSRTATQIDRLSIPIPHLLTGLLADRHPKVRFWAATLLQRYAGSAKINRLLALASDDSDPEVRKAAIETLGKAGGPQAAESALRRLDDPVWYVRAHAVKALGDLRRLDFAPGVVPLLGDKEWWVRAAAKQALRAMGPPVAPDVIPYLDSRDMFARNGAAEILQDLGVLDEMLAEAVRNDRKDEMLLIRKIMTAAAEGFVQAAIGRAEPAMKPRLLRVLKRAGVQAA